MPARPNRGEGRDAIDDFIGTDGFSPDSPDEMAFDQLRASILVVESSSYAGSGGRVLTDATGERRNRQFRQRFRGLRSCQPDPSGESGFSITEAARRYL